MAIGNALQAAVNGFIGGREVKHGWEDRKINQKRQARLDELREAAEVRAQESHGLDMETGGLMNTARRQSIRQTDQNWGDDQSLRGVLSEADQAATAGMAGAAAPDLSASLDPAVVSTSGGGLLAQQIAEAQRAATTPALGAIRPSPTDDRAQSIAEHRRGQPAPATPAVARRPQSAAPDPAAIVAAATEPALGAIRPGPQPSQSREVQGPSDPRPAIRAATQPARSVLSTPQTDDRAQAISEHRGGQMMPMGAIRPAPAGSADEFLSALPDGTYAANRQPQTAEEQRQLIELAKQGKLGMSATRQAQQREIDATAALDMPYDWGQPGRMLQDADRAGRIGRRESNKVLAGAGEMVANQAIGAMQGVNAPFQALSRYATGEDRIGAPQRVDLTGDGKKSSMATPFAESWGVIRSDDTKPPKKVSTPAHAPAAAGDAAPEAVKAASTAAAQVIDAVADAQPSTKAALEAMPAAALGVSKTVPMTEPQRAKAAKTYMQSYRENGAPRVIRELMRQGRLKEAQDFDQWVKDGRAEEGMTAWGRGMFAALQGDADGAADAFMDAYNSSGYFDDGMDVVKGKSAIIKNEAGDVVGVTLTMRNQATGEEFTQTDSIDGFIQKAAWITSPEQAFEASQARLQAQQQALLKAEEERRASARKLVEDNYTQTVSLARDMFAKSQAAAKAAQEAAMLTGKAEDVPPPMSWDEAFREAQRIMVDGPGPAEDPAASEPPVVARRAP